MSISSCDPIQSGVTEPEALPNSKSHWSILKSVASLAGAMLAIPLLIPYALTTQRILIREDVQAWCKALRLRECHPVWGLLRLIGHYPEFRTLYYHRLRYGNLLATVISVCCRFLYPGQTALFLRCPEIGSGLFLQHAFSTTVGAESIGRNCWINQQVTIGYTNATRGPVIGDHVTIYAGAKVLGPIRIGNNVTIGANAVVVKSVPDNCVVVGVPAQIVRRGGIRVRETL